MKKTIGAFLIVAPTAAFLGLLVKMLGPGALLASLGVVAGCAAAALGFMLITGDL